MKKIILLLLVLFILSYSFPQEKKETVIQSKIVGSWWLVSEQIDNQINYPRITFCCKNAAVFESMGDTLYHFVYEVINDSCLYLYNKGKGNKLCNKITMLNNDSLIFENLLEYDYPQFFYRDTAEFNPMQCFPPNYWDNEK
ncbi:MAG: hypothetical protein LBR81_07535 [Prevotellaceae bacterium]|jgi:hypothetical protein|nr:hypothetical protein [Prevotellaceae bacterium]